MTALYFSKQNSTFVAEFNSNILCCFHDLKRRHIDRLLSCGVMGFVIALLFFFFVKSYTWLKNTQDATLRIVVILDPQLQFCVVDNYK